VLLLLAILLIITCHCRLPFSCLVQLNAEYEAACELHDCPVLPVVRAHWLEGDYVMQVTEFAGSSLSQWLRSQQWRDSSSGSKVEFVRGTLADILLGLACQAGRVRITSCHVNCGIVHPVTGMAQSECAIKSKCRHDVIVPTVEVWLLFRQPDLLRYAACQHRCLNFST